MTPKREQRIMGAEVRVAVTDGVRHVVGHAATFNQPYDLGMFMEQIDPRAFTRCLAKKPDVKCLFNHDPNFIMGRTKSETLTLRSDGTGLAYDCIPSAGPLSQQAVEAIERGDVDSASFAFGVLEDNWTQERDDKGRVTKTLRTILDAELYDVGPVVNPANPNATSGIRSLPDGIPAEMRSFLEKRDAADGDPDAADCLCDCPECLDGDCADCTNLNCVDENCSGSMAARAARNKPAPTKRVNGEDLAPDCFLIAGDSSDTKTRKFPWKFSTEEKTVRHLRNCLFRFNETEVPDDEKRVAWDKLVILCKEHGIDPASDELRDIAERLTSDQLFDFMKDSLAIAAQAKVRAIAASL